MRNREGWEVKTLGEVCEIQRGGSPRPISKYITTESDGLNWIKIGDTVPGSMFINNTAEKIKPSGLSKTRFVSKGDFLLSNSMSFGRPYILNIDGCIHDGWLVIKDTNSYFDKSFLFYLLSSSAVKAKFKKMAVGGVVNNLNVAKVSSLDVAIPPLPTQHQIVAELDTLNSIIDKKKEQLNELDNLAQATFYDMFGDPVENEKGWEVKKLGDTVSLINGRAYKRDELLDVGKTPVLRVGNFFSSDKYYYSDLDLPPDKYCDYGDLLFAWSASFGAKIWDGGKVIYHYHIWKVDYKDNIYDKYFLLQLLNRVTNSLMNQMRGGIMLHLTKSGMEKTDFIVPPLSLQTQFAEKIKHIEQQKALIQRSIDDVQQLFDYTMDKYFN